MSIDVARYLRLRSAIRGSLSAIPEESATGNALADAYVAYRDEVRLLIAEDLYEEFDRLFPAWDRPKASTNLRGGYDPVASLANSNEARELLGRLEGWTSGFIAESQPD